MILYVQMVAPKACEASRSLLNLIALGMIILFLRFLNLTMAMLQGLSQTVRSLISVMLHHPALQCTPHHIFNALQIFDVYIAGDVCSLHTGKQLFSDPVQIKKIH